MTFKLIDVDRIIQVYNLLDDTKEFIGKGDAFISANTGLPANCTDIAPPETKAGMVAVFDSAKQKWDVCEDHRGEFVYSTENGYKSFISEIGAYPAGTTTIAPENAWQKWDGNGWVDDPEAKRKAQIDDALATKTLLLRQANEEISTLQDAVDMDMATEGENASLTEWKKYRVLLRRILPEDAPGITWPAVPENVA